MNQTQNQQIFYVVTFIHESKSHLCRSFGVYDTREKAVEAVIDFEEYGLDQDQEEMEIKKQQLNNAFSISDNSRDDGYDHYNIAKFILNNVNFY